MTWAKIGLGGATTVSLMASNLLTICKLVLKSDTQPLQLKEDMMSVTLKLIFLSVNMLTVVMLKVVAPFWFYCTSTSTAM